MIYITTKFSRPPRSVDAVRFVDGPSYPVVWYHFFDEKKKLIWKNIKNDFSKIKNDVMNGRTMIDLSESD